MHATTRARARAHSKVEKNVFDPYTRRMTTRNRTVNYQEWDSDSEDEVVFLSELTRPTRRSAQKSPKIAIEDPKPHGKAPFVKKSLVTAPSTVVEEESHAGRLFRSLPLEIHQNIAEFFSTDREVARYAGICKETNASISASVWRNRFTHTFDMPEGYFEPLMLAQKYAYRRDVLRKWACFDLTPFAPVTRELRQAHALSTAGCLDILRSLIIESNARKGLDAEGNEVIIGLNHEYILNWIIGAPDGAHTDIIDAVINTVGTSWNPKDIVSANTENSLVLVIQLCLTTLSLRPGSSIRHVSHFDLSQLEAYADFGKQPVFYGEQKQDINVRWLLHTVNFFKMHLKTTGDGLLAHEYQDLESDQLPQPWLGKIMRGTQAVGSHWKGAYTYIPRNELLRLRTHGHDQPIVDNTDETFSDLTIFFDSPGFQWPTAWEELIMTNPYNDSSSPSTRKLRSFNSKSAEQYELKTFFGTSRSTRPAHFFGRMHGLPEQQGIPGFQRISLIKFCHQEDGEFDPSQIWAYEGCVLPGGRIIVGRWWDLTENHHGNPIDTFGGPFIWWNVDNSTAEPPISSEEALGFWESIKDSAAGL